MAQDVLGPISFQVRLGDIVPGRRRDDLVKSLKRIHGVSNVKDCHGPELVVELYDSAPIEGIRRLVREVVEQYSDRRCGTFLD